MHGDGPSSSCQIKHDGAADALPSSRNESVSWCLFRHGESMREAVPGGKRLTKRLPDQFVDPMDLNPYVYEIGS